MSTRFRVGIFKEDHLIENASALLFLSAFSLSLYYLIVHRHSRLRSGGLLKVVCGLGLLGFLDEMSFGQRVFDLTMPRYGEVSIDATHDVVELALYLGKDCGWGCLATATIALIGAVTLLWLKGGALVRRFRRAFPGDGDRVLGSPALLFGCFLSLLAIAIVMDSWDELSDWYGIGAGTPRALRRFEEVAEMAAALALLLCFLTIRDQNSSLAEPTGLPDDRASNLNHESDN